MKLVTEEDKKEIKEKYSTTDTEELAKALGFAPGTIKLWAQKLGVKKAKGYIFHNCGKFTKEEKRFIHENYSTKSNEDISKIMNKTTEDIQAYACSKGLKKRADIFKRINGSVNYFLEKRQNVLYNYLDFLSKDEEPTVSNSELYKSKYGKYYVNRNYFNKIDNEWKAYWLGFLYADGWNSSTKCSMGIKLCLSDVNHVFRFKKSLQAENPVYYSSPKELIICGKKAKSNGGAGITINNQRLCDDLSNLGCVEHKTYILQFPTFDIVPESLLRHFIRGFFDGDGWVSVLNKNKAPSVGFVGMKNFIISLSDYLTNKLDLTPVKYSQKNGAKTIEIDWCSLVDVERIYNFLYNNSNIFLQRKFEKLNKFYCLGQYEV